jgi:chemotaxis protein methyltransferase CheR
MIYFDTATRKNILKELHGTLLPGGWLLLGGAETAFGVEEWFEIKTVGSATVYVAR